MTFTITENVRIAKSTWRMVLTGDSANITRPGQFVQLQVPGFYLRRPISVCDFNEQSLTLIYKVIGRGTEAMTRMRAGDEADLLTGLGNGYTVKPCKPLLIGGGCGIPPLYKLCKALIEQGMIPQVVLGFHSKDEVFLEDEFKALGAAVTLTTVDGTCGEQGFATQAADTLAFDYVYACGPDAMLKAVYKLCESRGVSGQFSLEERMACGFGACMGCSIHTVSGAKRVCADGPIFEKEELPW
ncbi:MAG: dihydroorotate dehydrogenase electron transfer subunit [Firmicutes bacterium]|nr:dihydroorotate dehydrogenase electron transfer subunit [Bacillota bacterium]